MINRNKIESMEEKSYLFGIHNETYLNFFLRKLRAILRRLRGMLLFGRKSKVKLGSKPRFLNLKNISLSHGVAFGESARIEAHSVSDADVIRLSIGKNSTFGDYCHIGAMGKIIVGNDVLAGSNVLIIDHNHGNVKVDLSTQTAISPRYRKLNCTGDIFIGDNVWIGDRATILGGAHIGSGCVVGVGAIVKGAYPEYSLIR